MFLACLESNGIFNMLLERHQRVKHVTSCC